MSTTMQLSDLMTAVRQRSDQESSQFISDAEITSYINQSYFELYDILVSEYGNNYYVAAPVTIVTDGVNDQYALPDGVLYSGAASFYKLLGLDLSVNGQQWIALNEFQMSERNMFTPAFYGPTLKYRINGNSLWLSPKPQGAMTLRLWYVPRMTQLVSATDTVDGVSGWTEYIICDAAIKCMQKEESDVSILMAQKNDLIRRIQSNAQNRNASEPARVSDVSDTGIEGIWPWR